MSVDAAVIAARAAVDARDPDALAALSRAGTDLGLLVIPGPEGPRTLLESVLLTGDVDLLHAVLALPGVSAGRALPEHGSWCWARGAALEVVRAFVEHPGVDPTHPDADGMTLLHELASAGAETAVVTWVLDRVPVDPRAKDGSTPLAHALGNGNLALAAELRRRGADLDPPSAWNGWTPLVTAVVAGMQDVVDWLLAQDGTDVRRGDSTGATALHHAARLGRTAALDALLARPDLDAQARDGQGATALMDAARHGRADVVAALLRRPDAGADLVDRAGRTALQHALDAGASDVAELLRPFTTVPATAPAVAPADDPADDGSGPAEVAIGDPPMDE
ncbi:ankyrin repeat domain-containing protein [Cellulomonas sp. URHB0016]